MLARMATGAIGDATGRIIVLCGLPGAGKTTTARAIVAERPGVRLCTDEWMTRLGFALRDTEARVRVDALQIDIALDIAGSGGLAVYESGGWTRAERDELRSRARDLGIAIELRHLDVPLETLWVRVAARNVADPPISVVIGRDELSGWWDLFERPDADELVSYDATVEGARHGT